MATTADVPALLRELEQLRKMAEWADALLNPPKIPRGHAEQGLRKALDSWRGANEYTVSDEDTREPFDRHGEPYGGGYL